MKLKRLKLGKFFFEFASVFIAVIAAFALENWNDNRRDTKAEEKILIEIRNGLKSDFDDMQMNRDVMEMGIRACEFFRAMLTTDTIKKDSLPIHYFNLTANCIPLVNRSGYEGLKSKGLEIIKNDSLRSHIISIYEFDYERIRKTEEETAVFQFYTNFGEPINQLLDESFIFADNGFGFTIEQPLKLNTQERKLFLIYLMRIQALRMSTINVYNEIKEEITKLMVEIDQELAERD